MAIEKIDIEKFLVLAPECPVFDVRSPGEFLHAHIPEALPLPLFSDEERKIIGIAYKQQSRQVAVKKGLDFFSQRMKEMQYEAEQLIVEKENDSPGKGILNNNHIVVHCWRGGMRSGAVAWLLDMYGFKVSVLKGGYKAFRRWALQQFEKEYKINIIGGYTGSGKTAVLHELKQLGKNIIDLENLACHKGSAFGALGEKIQPSQEMFENLLGLELYRTANLAKNTSSTGDAQTQKDTTAIWLEDESKHIGTAGIPKSFWNKMRTSPLYFLEIPFEERLKFLVESYGAFDKSELADSVMRIQKRLGGLETNNAINFLQQDKIPECFSILLTYYDKHYKNSLHNRENIETLLNKIPCETVDIRNAHRFLAQQA